MGAGRSVSERIVFYVESETGFYPAVDTFDGVAMVTCSTKREALKIAEAKLARLSGSKDSH